MTVHFEIADFLQPAALVKYRWLFSHGQWLSPDELVAYQRTRLRAMVEHAYAHVPYYRDLFDSLSLTPADIREIGDLRRLPPLSKQTVRHEARRLTADNAACFRPVLHHTSGTTGARHAILLDRETNALEFAYYWRYWNWAGYRLGDRFAEFSSSFFSRPDRHTRRFEAQRLSGRLLLSSLSFAREHALGYARAIESHGARFLKGLPSVLAFFASFLRDAGRERLPLQAVFTTGELLLPAQRRLIERCFDAPVYDSYGTMERLVAICECPARRMHVNSDYGLLELGDDKSSRTCLGTSLYNHSMPLLRYELGDVIEPDPSVERCPCGRSFPVVRALSGRTSQSLVTPDGRVVPTLFLAFREVAGIAAAQVEQMDRGRIAVRIAATPEFTPTEAERLLHALRWHVGSTMAVDLVRVRPEEMVTTPSGKVAPIVGLTESHA
jgi:phenylacetate-CoA ligase